MADNEVSIAQSDGDEKPLGNVANVSQRRRVLILMRLPSRIKVGSHLPYSII